MKMSLVLLTLFGQGISSCQSNVQEVPSYEECVRLGEQAVENYDVIINYKCVGYGVSQQVRSDYEAAKKYTGGETE